MNHFGKRALCLLVCICVLASCLPAVSAYYGVSNWAETDVAQMEALGLIPDSIINGNMSANITRGEMCQMAVLVYEQLTGVPCAPAATDYFSDTTDPTICYAKELGIIEGYSDGTFRPNSALTRQDFFKITYNLMTNALWWDSRDLELVDLTDYSDTNQISTYALAATQTMVTIGVVKGAGNAILPQNSTNRQEAIAMFLRAYHYMCNWYAEQDDTNNSNHDYLNGYTGISTWAIREITQMQSLGMIPQSLASCNMSAPISRTQMCEIALLAYNNITKQTYTAKDGNYFTDTNNPAVNATYELGIVSGYGNGKFGPNDALTREQFFKIMANFMSAVDYPRTDANSVNLSNYSDSSSISSWAVAPTRLLIYIGAVGGYNGKIDPKASTTCQEALAVFLRCYNFTTSWKDAHPDGIDDEPSVADDIVAYAMTFVGYDYVYGGASPSTGFDCSGFVYYIYKQFGYSLSRTATAQYNNNGIHVSKSELLPGDLVFFSSTPNGSSIGHVGLYIGGNQFVHAANSSKGVIVSSLSESWYAARYYGACRIVTN